MLTQGVQILRDTARSAFWQGWDNFPTLTDSLTYIMRSDSDQETYAWLAYAPSVREMSGVKLKQDVPELSFTLKNKLWEVTTAIPYSLWKWNKNGAVAQLAAETGKKGRQHRDNLISTLIKNGGSTACYDTQNFFSSTHSDPGALYTTSQSNLLTYVAATGTVPTDIEMAGAVAKGIGTLMSFKDGAGDPVTYGAVSPGQIEIHSSIGSDGTLFATLMRVASAQYLTSGASNYVQGLFKAVYNPFLTANDYIFIFNTGTSRKPCILQIAEDVAMEDDFGGDNEFNTKDRCFGAFGAYNATYGDWRSAISMQFT
jgi:phage major head subunit gpT-like protein